MQRESTERHLTFSRDKKGLAVLSCDMASVTRTAEIFLACCLEGNASVVSRILKRNRKSWTGIIPTNTSFNINTRDRRERTGLMLACLSGSVEVLDLLLSRWVDLSYCLKVREYPKKLQTKIWTIFSFRSSIETPLFATK